ncbi:MAG: cytochrome P450 family protein [Chloroflexota bacterium]
MTPTTSRPPYPFWETATRPRAQALYAQVRQQDPVHRAIGPVSGNPLWFLTRHADCVQALKDPRLGREPQKHLPPAIAGRYMGELGNDDNNPFAAINRNLLNMDPPDHTRLRALVHKAFTPRMVENLRPRIAQIAADLLDTMGGKTETDLISDYAFPLPVTVIAEMLGVPASDRDRFREWTRVLLFDGTQETAAVAAMEVTMYLNEMIDARQAEPTDDLISALVQAEDDGTRMDRLELLGMIFLLLVAGHETTVNLIGNGMLALMQHPDQLALLRTNLDDPTLVKAAIEEILRYNGPVETAMLRIAYEDVAFGDTVIPAGEGVLPVLLAANRDPAVFDAPDRFDITRQDNRHIAFGSGIHYCVGAPLARLEGQIAIPALIARFESINLAIEPDALEWNPSLLLHGVRALPVALR